MIPNKKKRMLNENNYYFILKCWHHFAIWNTKSQIVKKKCIQLESNSWPLDLKYYNCSSMLILMEISFKRPSISKHFGSAISSKFAPWKYPIRKETFYSSTFFESIVALQIK